MELALIVNLLARESVLEQPSCSPPSVRSSPNAPGVLNLGVEGMMLMGAMTAFGVAYGTGSPWLGLLAAALVGGLLALLHAFVTVTLRADQVVSGLALTFVGAGLSAVLGSPLIEVKQAPRLPAFDIPLLADIPILGPIFFQHNVIVYLGFILIPAAWFYINRTRPGLELRAIGEYPAAADVQGISVSALRYLYVAIGGILAGIGGAALSLAITPSLDRRDDSRIGLDRCWPGDFFRVGSATRRFRLLSLWLNPPLAFRSAEPCHLPTQPRLGILYQHAAVSLYDCRSDHRLARGDA